jgi:protein-tyrosine sulfotransferase
LPKRVKVVAVMSAEDARGSEAWTPAPLVVIGCAHSGVRLIREALIGSGQIAWIDTPRLVSATEQIAGLWRAVDGRPAPKSLLAQRSIGGLLRTMVAGRLIDTGCRTWAVATEPMSRECLDLFALLLPTARFICVHRSCHDVVVSGGRSMEWELGGHATIDTLVTRFPTDPVTGWATYWAEQTEALISFEMGHRERCLRLRFEDLRDDRTSTESALASFLASPATLAQADVVPGEVPGWPGCLPSELRARVRALYRELGYES